MDRPIQRLGQTEAPIDLAEKYHPTVTGTITASKTAFDFATIKAWKLKEFRGTFWHWRSSF